MMQPNVFDVIRRLNHVTGESRVLFTVLRSLVLFTLVTLTIGCAWIGSSPTVQRVNPGTIFETLSTQYPDGIPIDGARQTMLDAGFECEFVKEGSFTHRTREPETFDRQTQTYNNVDFLKCSRKTQDGIVTYFDTVALLVENGVVIKMLANFDAVGP